MKRMRISLIVALLVLGVGGVALAYWWGTPHWGYGPGPGFYGRGEPFFAPYGGISCPLMGPLEGRYGFAPHHLGKGWGFRGWGGASMFAEGLEALSKASNVPTDKLRALVEKYPMPPKLILRVVALSQILNKDVEDVAKDFRDNPSLYLWKNNIDPSNLMKKEWEIRGKLFEEIKKGVGR